MFANALTGKLMGGLSIALAIALAAFAMFHFFTVGLLKHTITQQAESIATLTQEKSDLTATNLKMVGAIQTQNAKIDELVKAQDAASKAADIAIAKAKIDSKKWKSQYAVILNAPRPSGDDCKDLALKLGQYFDLRKKEVSP